MSTIFLSQREYRGIKTDEMQKGVQYFAVLKIELILFFLCVFFPFSLVYKEKEEKQRR